MYIKPGNLLHRSEINPELWFNYINPQTQALIRDKRNPNLYLLAASQTKDKTVLTVRINRTGNEMFSDLF